MNYLTRVYLISEVLALFGLSAPDGEPLGVPYSPFPYGDLDG